MFFNDQYEIRRKTAGLTFDDIAKAVGVQKSMAYEWAKKAQPRRKKIPLIANVLNCCMSDICDDMDSVSDYILSLIPNRWDKGINLDSIRDVVVYNKSITEEEFYKTLRSLINHGYCSCKNGKVYRHSDEIFTFVINTIFRNILELDIDPVIKDQVMKAVAKDFAEGDAE